MKPQIPAIEKLENCLQFGKFHFLSSKFHAAKLVAGNQILPKIYNYSDNIKMSFVKFWSM